MAAVVRLAGTLIVALIAMAPLAVPAAAQNGDGGADGPGLVGGGAGEFPNPNIAGIDRVGAGGVGIIDNNRDANAAPGFGGGVPCGNGGIVDGCTLSSDGGTPDDPSDDTYTCTQPWNRTQLTQPAAPPDAIVQTNFNHNTFITQMTVDVWDGQTASSSPAPITFRETRCDQSRTFTVDFTWELAYRTFHFLDGEDGEHTWTVETGPGTADSPAVTFTPRRATPGDATTPLTVRGWWYLTVDGSDAFSTTMMEDIVLYDVDEIQALGG